MQNQIPKNWQKVRLGEIADFTNGKSIKISNSGEFLIYGSNGLIGRCDNYNYEDGVIIGRVGVYCGSLRYEKDKFWATDNTIVARLKNETNNRYLFYLLQILALNHRAGGSAQPLLTQDVLNNIETNYPADSTVQKQIASILSAFDDKIEVNNKIAKTLEAMAQELFKEWFMNFRFPGYEKVEFVDSELGEIPKEWKVGFIKDLGKVITGKTPSTEIKENFGSEIPFITIPDMDSVFITRTERYLSEKGSKKMQNMLLPTGSICVSCIATVGLVGITTQQSLTNQQINSVIPNKEKLTYFLYIYLRNKKKDLELFGSGGTATLIINKTKFENLDLIIPNENILRDFHSIVEPMYEKILSVIKENQKLAALRDLLLPKLMKGEVEV